MHFHAEEKPPKTCVGVTKHSQPNIENEDKLSKTGWESIKCSDTESVFHPLKAMVPSLLPVSWREPRRTAPTEPHACQPSACITSCNISRCESDSAVFSAHSYDRRWSRAQRQNWTRQECVPAGTGVDTGRCLAPDPSHTRLSIGRWTQP